MNRKELPTTEIIFGALLLLALVVFCVNLMTNGSLIITITSVLIIVLFVYFYFHYSIDPDRLQARQSERTLNLAAKTLPFMQQGLNQESAQAVCQILLPATLANAVAITDREVIMGFAGAEEDAHPLGSPIMTSATLTALNNGEMQVITSQADIGFTGPESSIQAAIIVPLILRDEVIGVLKFYYRSPKRIDATQQAMAEGLGQLLTMQLSLAELESQRELATVMRIKALQAQINPHFLFNTINTIASLIRTDPARARILLREFSAFYRATLEGSLDLITLDQEHLQSLRYFGFELARFGPERLTLDTHIEAGLGELEVPAFIIQPIIENAVAHGMRDNAPLHIDIKALVEDNIIRVRITDNGIGMTTENVARALEVNHEHAGIALQNVDERLRSYFGKGAGVDVQSTLGVGTTVVLTLGEIGNIRQDQE
jgi:two-component system sensor histidine kinase LytS